MILHRDASFLTLPSPNTVVIDTKMNDDGIHNSDAELMNRRTGLD